MEAGESGKGSPLIKDSSEGASFEFPKNYSLVIDHESETNVPASTDLSPFSCLDGDIENCATSSVASCSDSGICSTPHNEEEIGFEDIPLNASDLRDGIGSSNFESSLSEKLSRMDASGVVQLEGKKSAGKLR